MIKNNNLVREFLLGRVSITLPDGKVFQVKAPVYGLLPSEDLDFLREGEKYETV